MVTRFGLAAALGIVGFAAGAGLMTVALGASAPPPMTHPQIVSSSTNLQSFLWVFEEGSRTITFCFTAASPPSGPQYDFSCRTHPLNEAVTQ